MSETKVLAFEDRASRGYYCELANAVFGAKARISTLSDFRGVGEKWTGEFIYSDAYDDPNDSFETHKLEIIARCRFLRSLPAIKAETLARRVWNGIEQLFDKESYQAVFQRMVDNYTLDIVARIANIRNIPVVSFVGHFFSGYFRITVRGELNIIRDTIDPGEVNAVCSNVLRDEFKPSFDRMKEKTRSRLIKTYVRRKLIEEVYYPLKKFIDRDPDNYHYGTLVLRSSNCAYVSRKRYENFSTVEDLRRLDRRKIVYLPLHMIPEATTDYWCDDWRQVQYEDCVANFVANSSSGIVFAIKEHPSMDGWRDPSFYKRLKEFPNVLLLPPSENSNAVLACSNAVAVHTGSVGVEALMRHMRAFCLTRNYYSGLHPAAQIVSSINESDLSAPVPRYDTEYFVEALLKGLYAGTWRPNKQCRESTFNDLVAASRLYLERFDG